MSILGGACCKARGLILISLIAAASVGIDSTAADSREKQQQQFATAPEQSSIELPTSAPAQPRFFTINEVLALHDRGLRPDQPTRLASVNPTETLNSYDPPASHLESNDEPFSLQVFRAPEGALWVKWRKLEDELRDDARVLADCRSDRNQCGSPAALHLLALVDQARSMPKRAQIGTLNRTINLAIRYVSDLQQYGVADLWSAPLATLTSGKGDCEDYAIAKLMALRELGMKTEDLRLVLARDTRLQVDHAVLAVRYEEHWLILDNRTSHMVAADEIRQFTPLVSLGDAGVKLFAAPYLFKQPLQTADVAAR
jgi:predicted transglutaminase-like cysteine proteinase